MKHMGEMKKSWHDDTRGGSNIEGINFPADRYWKTCSVTMNGIHRLQLLSTEVWTDKKIAGGSQDGEGQKKYQCGINGMCVVTVNGYLKNKLNPSGAVGEVIVTCTYDDDSVVKSESKTWEDRTAANSLIQDLFLPADHTWLKCEIRVDFHSSTTDNPSTTGCMVTLIKNGELAFLPDGTLPLWAEKVGAGSVSYLFDINAKVSLVAAGYISNKIAGGGAKVTLTGYYKE